MHLRGQGWTIALAAATSIVLAGAMASSATAAGPANDNFADALVLPSGLPAAHSGNTTLDGTRETGEPATTGPNSVWFTWNSGTASGLTMVDACQGSSDPSGTELHLWTGAAVNALTEIHFSGIGDAGCNQRFRIQPGTTYRISVGNLNPGPTPSTSFDLSLSQYTSAPANDDYANPAVVGPALPVYFTSTTNGANSEPGEPVGLGGQVARSVWFSWTAPSTAQVRIDACDFSGNVAVGIYTAAASPGAASELAVTPFNVCDLTFTPAAGTEYRIGVAGFASPDDPDFTLRIRSTSPPANDMYANATTLPSTNPVSLAGDNTFATTQANEPAGTVVGGNGATVGRSVWYRWTAPATETVRISACPDIHQPFLARLGVYEDTGGLTVGQLAAHVVGVAPNFGPYCRKKVSVVAGHQYVIELASTPVSEDEGPFLVEIHTFAPPANDLFADAQELGSGLPATATGTNVDASVEAPEDDAGFATSHATVWYGWTAPASGNVRMELCDADFLVSLSAWTGSAIDNLTEVTADAEYSSCGPDGFGLQVPFPAVAGTRYWIRVGDSGNDQEGTFTLRLTDPDLQPPGGGGGGGGGAPGPQPPPPEGRLAKCKKIKSKKKRKKCVKKARGKKKKKKR